MTEPGLSINFSTNNEVGSVASVRMRFSEMVFRNFPHTANRGIATTETLRLQELLPSGIEILKTHRNKYFELILAKNTEHLFLLDWTINNNLTIDIASPKNSESAWNTVQAITDRVPVTKLEDDTVKLWTWYLGPDGPRSSSKTIKAPRWADAERNYTPATAAGISEIMKMSKPDVPGKILLWRGEPGTGKTSAIRTLMREWKSWCNFHYVSDPEKLFLHPGYLLQVGAAENNEWRLVITEDTDEFVRARGVKDAQGSMSRLLNFADGILGQGCNTLFLLTTNEKIDKLHPALIRPGRCAAQIEFSKFGTQEISDWLPAGSTPPTGERTLAELIEHVRDENNQIITEIERETAGMYL